VLTLKNMIDAYIGNKINIGQRRYLGSKTKLLNFIQEILETEDAQFNSFADIFAGTGVVANHFAENANIIVNDILESNYLCYTAFFGSDPLREEYLINTLQQYNSTDYSLLPQNYFSVNFANTYFDEVNAQRIGSIREDIEQLFSTGEIGFRERAYLITSLIYALDRIANTVGHYDAYRKVDIRSKQLLLRPLATSKRNMQAQIFKADANDLVRKITADVVYIDPPYNSRQYSDSYHLLENVACWKREAVYGVAKKINREHIKSRYSMKTAGSAFSDLINNIRAKYILVSYNDMGTNGDPRSQSRISDNEIMSALERRGEVKIYQKLFNQFTTGLSKKDDLKERIFFCRLKDKVAKIPPATSLSSNNSHAPKYVKSPLNYTGGKHKLLPQLEAFWPKNIATFYDIFCGGANVGINAQAKKIVCIDINLKVIELLRLIQKTNFESLHQEILSLVERYSLSQSYSNGYEYYNSDSSSGLGLFNKKGFLELRKAYNSASESAKPMMLLVLILYAFNNQIRFNAKGEFNLPVGKRDYNGSSRHNLASFNLVANQKNVSFLQADFHTLNKIDFEAGDFVYLDPPYLLGLATYNENGGWSYADEIELYNTLSSLDDRGVRFALSNVSEHKGELNNILLNWANESGYTINKLNFDYGNSNYQSSAKRSVTKEVLVTNYKV
jgi:adenine-specific DNA-methyltransferase